jgi:hypothetical protein
LNDDGSSKYTNMEYPVDIKYNKEFYNSLKRNKSLNFNAIEKEIKLA